MCVGCSLTSVNSSLFITDLGLGLSVACKQGQLKTINTLAYISIRKAKQVNLQ